MVEQRSRRRFLAGVGAGAALGAAGCAGSLTLGKTDTGSDDAITVFHAGSLAPPFAAAEEAFEAETGVTVNREAKGSVFSTQKITEQGRPADVLGVSDFRLLRNRLLPEFGDWYAIFATNAMSIQYREDSPGADEISTDNWWEVLSRDDVTVGHSDPAVDPGGYRAVMTQQLGAIEFQGSRLYDDATYEQLRANSTVPTGTEIRLKSHLESGKLDYALYYRSIASTTDMPSVDLQPEVDLSKATPEYAGHYANAAVETASGTFTGAPIAYGLTVPSVAESPDLGAQWVAFVLGEDGQDILADEGFTPISPAVVPASGADAVPERVMSTATAQSNLGPMEL